MIIDVSDILTDVGSSKDFEGTIDIGDISFQGEKIQFNEPLSIKGNVLHGGELIYLSAHVDGELGLKCGLCLESYSFPVDYDMEVSLKSFHDLDDPDAYLYADDLIKLDDIIISELLLRLPMQRRCSKECRGLCLNCGANLNKGECQCLVENQKPIDSRFAILEDFIVNSDREE